MEKPGLVQLTGMEGKKMNSQCQIAPRFVYFRELQLNVTNRVCYLVDASAQFANLIEEGDDML